MTTSKPDTEAVFGGWDADELLEAISDDSAGGAVFRLDGVPASAVQRDMGRLRRELTSRNRLALALDPTGGPADGESFREVTTTYAQYVQERGELDAQTDELIDFLASARRADTPPHHGELSGRTFKNSLCRIWRSLSERVPASLFVFHSAEASSAEQRALQHFVSEFFVDPVSEFVPELEQPGRIESSLVFVGSVPDSITEEEVEVRTVDVSESARARIRERLSSDNVVDQFIASTGGDPRQLEALLETLPDDCESFWRFRYRRLERPEQRVVELLAVAGEPISLEALENAWRSLELDGEFSPAVRRLTEDGFVERRIEDGTVRLQLEDGAFRRGLREELEESHRAVLHGVLARGARDSQLEEADDRFLAEHFLAAGQVEVGFEFGMRAARRLHGEYALEEARELFERLLECDPDDSSEREIRNYLLDIYGALGARDQGLEEAEALLEVAESTRESARLVAEQGKILVRAGEYEPAEEKFREVEEMLDGDPAPVIRASAVFGRAESRYLRGLHDEASELAEEAVERLEEAASGDGGSPELERTMVVAKNLNGRLHIADGELDEAEELFESNRIRARERGWTSERDRAEINLAVIDLHRGDESAALEALEEIRGRSPGPEGSKRTSLLVNLGVAADNKGEYATALERYRAALREARRADFVYGIGFTAYNLAQLLDRLGAYDQTLRLIERLESHAFPADRARFIGPWLTALRVAPLIQSGKPDRALEVLEELDRDEPADLSGGLAYGALVRGAHAHIELGQFERARDHLDEIEIPEDLPREDYVGGLKRSARARLAFEDEAYERAAALGKEASELLRDSGFFQDAVRASVVRIRALRALERTGEAESLVERRLSDYHEVSERIPEAYREHFFSIPAYRDLVEANRELAGEEVPRPFRKYVEPTDRNEPEEAPEPSDEAYRQWRSEYSEVVGEDERLLKIFRRIDQIADSDSPVLVQGDSGTGKELVAEAIHRKRSENGEEPFVKVNCGAFVDNLLLSELFGHEKGAFTGAVEQKVGRFEQADGGTIFLDEIGEISKKAQVALLRVLQEGEFERVGGTETHCVDARLICATNRDLEAAVESGEFRLDLYYRLKGILLELPALEERRQDIPRLVRHFARANASDDEPPKEFSRDVMEFLASYSWPGNVRELKNFVRSILLFVDGERVEMDHLRDFRDFFSEGEVDLDPPEIDYDVPAEEYDDVERAGEGESFENAEDALVQEIVSDGRDLSELKERIEYESIRRALRETEGNITQAAEILQMTRPRLSQIVNSDDELVELKEKLVG